MSNGAKKGQRNAYALAVAGVLAMQADAATQDVKQETSQVEIADTPQIDYRHALKLRKLTFRAAASEGAFVVEPEAYEGEDFDDITFTSAEQVDLDADDVDQNDPDRGEILAATQGPSGPLNAKGIFKKTCRIPELEEVNPKPHKLNEVYDCHDVAFEP